ncbi:MAG TPA: hypothetical protein VFS43_08500 [Polyangiaceae bacterium]|nr:hypothetical protein [Polyangiaceae bacterium]
MFDPEAATLRNALRTAQREGVGRGYPKALRARVVAYAQRAHAAGRTRAEVANVLGLTPVTLARWTQPTRPMAPAFRRVVVAPEPGRAAQTGGVTVVTNQPGAS